MCKYCKIETYENSYQWVAEESIPSVSISGFKNCLSNVEIGIQDNPEDEHFQLFITSCNWDIEFNIKYCPMCGKKL